MSQEGACLFDPSDEPLELDDLGRPACSGLTASWCPVHGDCTCPPHPDPEHLCAWDCPLHGPDSDHPATRWARVAEAG